MDYKNKANKLLKKFLVINVMLICKKFAGFN